ncbi:hypothetical protein A2U01_0106207, partial [Trifolium medium]|nr:hypothetical protein [Trifolium medium]
ILLGGSVVGAACGGLGVMRHHVLA